MGWQGIRLSVTVSGLDEFRRRWSAHNMRTHGTGVKHLQHRVAGDLTLAWESLDSAPSQSSP